MMAVVKNVTRRVLESDQGSREYFLGQISSRDARDLTFVPVIAEEATIRRRRTYLNETNNGYQRPGVARRMESFANYLESFPLAYTPAVVLSGRGEWKYSAKDNSLSIYQPAAIIDGQHRIGGFVCSFENNESERMIDFVLINFDSINEEEKIFIDINSHAKSVASGIVAVIGRSADVQVAELLNSHPDSLFKGRFFIAQSRTETLFNINSVMKEIGTTFSHGAFQIIANDVDLKFEIALAYWEEISTAFPSEWADIELPRNSRNHKLLELTGFITWSKAASEILAPAFDQESKTVDWDFVRQKINLLAESDAIDWSKSGRYANATGNRGAQLIHRDMQQLLLSKPHSASGHHFEDPEIYQEN